MIHLTMPTIKMRMKSLFSWPIRMVLRPAFQFVVVGMVFRVLVIIIPFHGDGLSVPAFVPITFVPVPGRSVLLRMNVFMPVSRVNKQ